MTVTRKSALRLPVAMSAIVVSGMALGGCMGSPTYGTDKTANQQLVEDLTGILSLAPDENPGIQYKPRPELVKPETMAVLPPPQDGVTTASAAWPESPEARRARIRAEATANQDNPLYRSGVTADISVNEQYRGPLEGPDADPLVVMQTRNPQSQRAEMQRRLAIQNSSGDPTSRRYLSEPPIEYRAPAATAPTDDIGEDEWRKERDARRAARKPGSRSWWPF